MTGSVLLAAGGTGGHLFPAAALAQALKKRGVEVDLATDARALKYGGDFPARAIHTIPSATTTGAGIVSKALATVKLGLGVLSSIRLIRKLKPGVVVGFGGYPTVPPLFAASLLGVPSILHEQNAVIGRANKFLSPRAFPTCAAPIRKQPSMSAIPCARPCSPPPHSPIPSAAAAGCGCWLQGARRAQECSPT